MLTVLQTIQNCYWIWWWRVKQRWKKVVAEGLQLKGIQVKCGVSGSLDGREGELWELEEVENN